MQSFSIADVTLSVGFGLSHNGLSCNGPAKEEGDAYTRKAVDVVCTCLCGVVHVLHAQDTEP